MCVALANTRLDVNRTVRQRLGVKKASFASPEETVEATGMTIGGVTPLGLPDGLRVWIDTAVMTPDWVIVGAGTRAAKIRLSPTEDLVRASGGEVVESGWPAPSRRLRLGARRSGPSFAPDITYPTTPTTAKANHWMAYARWLPSSSVGRRAQRDRQVTGIGRVHRE